MIYAHIYNDFGKFKVCYNRWHKFLDAEEEAKISKNLVATIEEPTGDSLLLAKKVVDYADAEGIRIERFPVSAARRRSLALVAELTESDRIEMLETAVKNLAALLHREHRRLLEALKSKKEARRALDRSTDIAEQLLYTLQVQNNIDQIAEEELGCEHVEPARGIYWERRERTDC